MNLILITFLEDNGFNVILCLMYIKEEVLVIL